MSTYYNLNLSNNFIEELIIMLEDYAPSLETYSEISDVVRVVEHLENERDRLDNIRNHNWQIEINNTKNVKELSDKYSGLFEECCMDYDVKLFQLVLFLESYYHLYDGLFDIPSLLQYSCIILSNEYNEDFDNLFKRFDDEGIEFFKGFIKFQRVLLSEYKKKKN